MITYNTKKSLIYEELSEEKRKEFFNLKGKKFLHNIDSLYYVVYLDVDYNSDVRSQQLVEYLDMKKRESIDNLDISIYDEIDSSLITSGLGFGMFAYSIEKKDKYIIFVARKKANEDTPEIIVQIRSQFLWLYGEHRAVQESFNDLKVFLNFFGIGIWKTQENRLDYAYHTNYIQDPLNFFKEENLNKMQVSRFTRWHKEGRFVGDEGVECDYISLGRRKSNNTFIRIYNKCQEVVNQQYKQFFIKVWLLNGLINRFDYFVLERCFEKSSYNYVDKARLEFYLKYGQDYSIKKQIRIMLKKKDSESISKLANKLVPNVTLILNIEFQTKRKFYSTMDNSIDLLKTVTCKNKELERIFKILDNKDLFHKFLTTHVIRFIDYDSSTRKSRCKTSNWWQRLQSIKLNNVIDDKNRSLIREYQSSLDVLKLKTRILNSISTFSIYVNDENDNDIASDVIDFMSFLNESDVENAIDYKNKKSPELSNRVQPVELPRSRFAILDLSTGEILNK